MMERAKWNDGLNIGGRRAIMEKAGEFQGIFRRKCVKRKGNGVKMREFIIENGVLTKYNGYKGTATIPREVTRIGKNAFAGNTTLTRVYMIYNGDSEAGRQN